MPWRDIFRQRFFVFRGSECLKTREIASANVESGTDLEKFPLARPAFPTATGPNLPALEKVVDERRCWMFSGPGKNYHTDREMAQQLGFPNIVVQGMMSTCFVHQLMQDHFGRGWVVGGKMSVKLTNVLWVDERVVAHAKVREESPEGTGTRVSCDVWVEKADGTKILVGDASALA